MTKADNCPCPSEVNLQEETVINQESEWQAVSIPGEQRLTRSGLAQGGDGEG